MSASDSSPPGKPEDHSDRSSKVWDRRLHERITINSHVTLCWEDNRGGRRQIKAQAVNVSPSGILLEAEEHVATGTVVIVQASNFAVLGKACVRHCEPKGLRYKIGLYVPGRLPRTF
ncbi:MAG TPA: PilZ domain-containing protein [Bryobacterales bacterium]|nr:PilZ domain-containing protein [Bryobacterales bacterium]